MNGENSASNQEQSNTHFTDEDNKRSDGNEQKHKDSKNIQTEKLILNASSESLCSRKLTAEDLGHKRGKGNTVDLSLKRPKSLLGPEYRDRQTNIANKQLNESDKVKSSFSNFQPASFIGCFQSEPLDLSFTPRVDPATIHEPAIQETENNLATRFDDALACAGPSHLFCDKCKEVFEYKYYLEKHRCKLTKEESSEVFESTFSENNRSKRGEINRTNKNPNKNDEGFETRSQESISILKRILTEEVPLCDICGKSFCSVNQLLIHKKGCNVSSKDKPYTCHDCNKRFKYKSNLVRHSLIHTDKKPHKCDKCGKIYSRKSSLKRHHKVCGSTDKKYRCKECPKKYLYKKDLVIHYRKHTGEKPYDCVKCGKSFSNPACFSIHKKSCDRSADDLPFACDKCNKKFTRRGNLVNHSLIHSGENL